MKKSMMKVMGIAILLVGLASCGGGTQKPNNISIRPETTEVTGEFEGYIEIVDSDYELVDDWGGKMSIKMKAVKPYEGNLDNVYTLINGEFLDQKGMPVSGTGDLELSYNSRDKLKKLLENGSGETILQLEASFIDYKADEHAEKVKRFSLSSSLKEIPNNTHKKDNTNVSSNGDVDSKVDDMLDSYDDYMDSYVSIAKKMQKDPSDSEILSEYAEHMEKTTDLAKKLEKCKGDMSSSQIQRMAKIQSRMAEVL